MNIRIRERSDEKLVLRLDPSKWLYLLGGVMFFLVGVGVVWTLANRISLRADRHSIEYKVQLLGLITTRAFSCTSDAIEEVSLALSTGPIPTYSIQFATTERALWADFLWADTAVKQVIAENCQSAVSGKTGSFEYVERGTLLGVALGGACVGLGMLFFFLLQTITITMDRKDHQMELVQQRWLPFTKSVKNIDLRKIRRIENRERAIETDGSHSICFEVTIVCHNGLVVPICNEHMLDKKSSLELRQLLDAWRSFGNPF